jgi:asparagine synthetase B (glutamine-hydrolysing)
MRRAGCTVFGGGVDSLVVAVAVAAAGPQRHLQQEQAYYRHNTPRHQPLPGEPALH